MLPGEFKPAILASKRPQTQVLNRVATGIGFFVLYTSRIFI